METHPSLRLKMPEGARTILKRLEKEGFSGYIVGGCVRDALLGKTPHDWDICTGAMPEQVKALFSGKHTVVETGIRHGTVTVVLPDGQYEVTTFRIDGDYSDNRHPDKVIFTPSLEEDLARRDFTMNAMACDAGGQLTDPFHGSIDLSLGLVRCVGDPEKRFEEDGLRILRAIRFASTGNFAIEPATEEAIHRLSGLLVGISAERKRDELCKLLLGDGAEEVLLRYRDVFARIIPELEPCFDFPQHNAWHDRDVYSHIAASVAHARRSLPVRLAMLLHDIGKPACCQTDEDGVDRFYGHGERSAEMADDILRRLKFDTETRRAVTELVKYHDLSEGPDHRTVRRLLGRLGPEQFARLLDVRTADVAAQSEKHRASELERLCRFRCIAAENLTARAPMAIKDLAVNGRDLMEAGFPSGPEIGRVLRALLELVLEDPEMNTGERLLEEALRLKQ